MEFRTAIYRLFGSGLPLCSALGLGPRADSIGIIMVHGVYPREYATNLPMPPSGMPFENLETNLLNLGGYSFIGMDEAVAMLRGDMRLRKRCLVLTFDDSLKALAEVAAPALIKWGIPATFYLSTDVLTHQRPYWWLRLDFALASMGETPVVVELPGGETITITRQQRDTLRRQVMLAMRSRLKPSQCERAMESIESRLGISLAAVTRSYSFGNAMSWDDACGLARKGFTIGSHTCSHPNLTLLSNEELRFELEDSKRLIEDRCGVACRHFCYPYGLYSTESHSAANAAGYESAVTTDSDRWSRRGDDLFLLRRFGLPRRPHQLRFLLTGMGRAS